MTRAITSLHAVVLASALGCTSPALSDAGSDAGTDAGTDAGPSDAGGARDTGAPVPDAGPTPCATDDDCADGVFCNGREHCSPGDDDADSRGCVPAAARCMPSQVCDEDAARCVTRCELDADADNDGHDAIACGGDDCDDSDPARSPSAVEVCDEEGKDEDCDPSTRGTRDVDGDGAHDAACCNVAADGNRLCETDCDDSDPERRPGASETCDGVDQDCDGLIDEADTSLLCRLAHADSNCMGGACRIDSCYPGRANCNASAADGCETDTTSDPDHCGACGNRCSTAACIGGRCATEGSDAVVGVAAGAAHSCALYRSGRVRCWGGNQAGELGDGSFVQRHTAAAVIGIYDAVELSVGGHGQGTSGTGPRGWSCVRRAGGGARCWGAPPGLGTGATDAHPLPDDVPGLTSLRGIDVSEGDYRAHTCAWDAAGIAWCWGERLDDGGGLDGGAFPSVAPAEVTDVVGVAPGQQHTCALQNTGSVVCWGTNRDGQCGAGTTTFTYRTGISVVGITDATMIAGGVVTTCVVRAGGAAACWGHNFDGQVGNGSTLTARSPAAVVGLTDAVQIGVGWTHACALRRTGRVVCWGTALGGELGEGSPSYVRHLTPGPEVSGLTDAVQISLGYRHSCALRANGDVVCWGRNERGQLGDGTTTNRSTPVRVLGLD